MAEIGNIITWRCTACLTTASEPEVKLLDRRFGIQTCITCKKKRVYQMEVNRDAHQADHRTHR